MSSSQDTPEFIPPMVFEAFAEEIKTATVQQSTPILLAQEVRMYSSLVSQRVLGQLPTLASLYRDPGLAEALEKKLNDLELQVKDIFVQAEMAFRNGGTYDIQEDSLFALEKYLLLMRFRHAGLYDWYGHNHVNGCHPSDRKRINGYMKKNGFKMPRDIWFNLLQYILDCQDRTYHTSSVSIHLYDQAILTQYPGRRHLVFYGAECDADEFILTENPVKHPDVAESHFLKTLDATVLLDNEVIFPINGHLLLASTGARDRPPDRRVNGIVELPIRRLTSAQVVECNHMMLDEAHLNSSIIYRSPDVFRSTVETYLRNQLTKPASEALAHIPNLWKVLTKLKDAPYDIEAIIKKRLVRDFGRLVGAGMRKYKAVPGRKPPMLALYDGLRRGSPPTSLDRDIDQATRIIIMRSTMLSFLNTKYALEKKKLASEKEKLVLEKGRLALEKGKLALKNKKLALKNKKLTLENEKLTLENEKLTLENEKLALENEKLALRLLQNFFRDLPLERIWLMDKITRNIPNLLTPDSADIVHVNIVIEGAEDKIFGVALGIENNVDRVLARFNPVHEDLHYRH